MPSHIYLRVGDYRSASRANERAIAVDETYIAKHNVRGLYAMMYYPHNVQFLWYSASMEGRSREAIEAARKLYGLLAEADHHEMIVMIGWMRATPLFAWLRFGKWEEVLSHPRPPCESTLDGSQFVGLIVKLGLSMFTWIDRIRIGMPPMIDGTVSDAAKTCAVSGSMCRATRTTTTP